MARTSVNLKPLYKAMRSKVAELRALGPENQQAVDAIAHLETSLNGFFGLCGPTMDIPWRGAVALQAVQKARR